MLQQVMTNPGEIIFREVPVPKVKDDQVLVKIINIGICGSDIHVYHGKHPFTKYPVTQGHEVSGEIAKVGKDVTEFHEGQKVTIEPQVYCGQCYPCRHGKYNLCEELKVMGFQTTGTASEYFAVDASKVTPIPEDMSYEEGAMIEPLAVAVHGVKQVGDVKGLNIAVLGAGAMGSIYGGHLSLHNDVYMIDKKQEIVDKINADGLKLFENDKDVIYRPEAMTDSANLGEVDLVILFVKALFSKAALEENRHIIGEHTYVMTLQNGAGHEDILSEFVPKERIIIGTTEDNGAVLDFGYVRRGGKGKTNIGMLVPDSNGMLGKIKESFDSCGFDTHIYDNIQQLIWDKLFTNVSLSALTGVLQVPIGFIAADEYAWSMTVTLIKEALAVAKALGLEFDEQEIIERVRNTSISSPEGKTSIYADLKAGRRTEVNTISGAVVRAGEKTGVDVPTHRMIVNMVHAMEDRDRKETK